MKKYGFTLLELLILLGLAAALAAFVIFVLHPKELWQEAQDVKRISESNKLKAELLDYFSKNPGAGCNDAPSSLAALPKDFSYRCDPDTKTFEIDAKLESARYSKGGKEDVESNDSGDDPDLYEVGNNLNL